MDVGVWLRGLRLDQYEQAFRENHIDDDLLPKLTTDDLREIGIVSVGHRRRIIEAAATLAAEPSPGNDLVEDTRQLVPGLQARVERRRLTVAFVDLVGSVSLSTKLDPEEMGEVIRAFHAAVSREVFRFDGHVAQYMGDGVLCYFGWPKAHENQTERAVRTALSLVDAVARLDCAAKCQLACRVGIATGVVVVGELLGEGSSREESAIGETPNLAARLQSLAAPGGIVVSDRTRSLLGRTFELVDLGLHALKGFSEPVKAWAVVGDREVQHRFEAARGERLAPLVGRDYERALIADRWSRAKGGEGQVVLLSGEPGIGKSRLAEHAMLDAGSEAVLHYVCSPYHQNSAYYPIIEQLERSIGLSKDDSLARRSEAIESFLEGFGSLPDDGSALIAALLDVPLAGERPAQLVPADVQKIRTSEVLLSSIHEMAAAAPLMIVLEDAQWLDPTSSEFFGQLIDSIYSLPVMFMSTFRPEYLPPWKDNGYTTFLTLNRLGREHIQSLVSNITGAKRLPEEVLAKILEKTDGVPLFVEELTRSVLESTLLRDAGDHYELSGPLPPLAIPETLHDSLMARLDRLSGVRDIAQIGSVVGRDFSHKIIEMLAPLDADLLQEKLSLLVDSGLVLRRTLGRETVYRFKHAFVQDVAYGSLLRSRRQELHAAVARVLLGQLPETAAKQPELIAYHLTEAGQVADAIVYWKKAGMLAAERSGGAEAVAHLRRCSDLIGLLPPSSLRDREELDVLTSLGSCLIATKGAGASEISDVYHRSWELCERLGETNQLGPVLQGLRLHYQERADMRMARKMAEELLSLATRSEEARPMLEAYRAMGVVSFFCGEFKTAHGHLSAGISLCESESLRSRQLRYENAASMTCLAYAGRTLWVLGYADQAVMRTDQAIEIAQATSHTVSLVEAWIWRAEVALLRGDFDDAQEYAAIALSAATDHSLPLWSGLAAVLLGKSQVGTGKIADGIALMRQGLARTDGSSDKLLLLYCRALLAEALLTAQQAGEAMSIVREVVRVSRASAINHWDAVLERLCGESFFLDGDDKPGAAERHFVRSLQISREQSARAFELRAAICLARFRLRQGRHAEAHGELKQVYDSFSEGFASADLTAAAEMLDRIESSKCLVRTP